MTLLARALLGVSATASATAVIAGAAYPFTTWDGVSPAAVALGLAALLAFFATILGPRGAALWVVVAAAVGAAIAAAAVSADAQGPGLEWASALFAAMACGLALIFAFVPVPGGADHRRRQRAVVVHR